MSSMKDTTQAAAPPAPAGAGNGSAGPVPYIGSRISLISKSAIRYEGTLYTIDTNESTVALQNVRSFGTEGRARPEGPIPPSPEVYDYIIFRGKDIMDLQVLRMQPPKPVAPYRDPAIVASAAPTNPQGQVLNQARSGQRDAPQPSQTNSNASVRDQQPKAALQPTVQAPKPAEKESVEPTNLPTISGWGPPPKPSEWGPPPQPADKQPYQVDRSGASGPRNKQGSSASNWRVNEDEGDRARDTLNGNGHGDSRRGDGRDGGGRTGQSRHPDAKGGRGRGGRGERGRRQRRRGPGITVPDEDFDFESMHQKFDKASVSEANGLDGDGIGGLPLAVKYDKSKGFFDELVSEKQIPRERSNAAQRRATDMETFGEAGNSYRYRSYRGRGRRGGGGGRGRRNQPAFRMENAD